MILYREMAENSDTLRAVRHALKAVAAVDRKLERARARSRRAHLQVVSAEAAEQAAAADLAAAQAERDTAAAELARAQAELEAPEPEPRRYFTRSEIAAAQARGRY